MKIFDDEMNKELEIFLIYFSSDGKKITFNNLVSEKDIMHIDDYIPVNFWWVYGGVEIVIDEYNTIFRSCNFHSLYQATRFLTQSLYWLRKTTSNYFDTDEEYPDDIVLKTTNGNVIRLQDYNESEIYLSYKNPEGNYERKRGDRFFDGVVLSKDEWFAAANHALSEYFGVMLNVLANNESDKKINDVMMGYYKIWKDIIS